MKVLLDINNSKESFCMKTFNRLNLALSLSLFYSYSCSALLLDLDSILQTENQRTEEGASILEQFKKLKELQIGGTHTYGNKIVIKDGLQKGQLDTQILIINPDPKAHDLNSDALSMIGSGFDPLLLSKLLRLCQLTGHFFDRIYINNVSLVLPIPENMPLEIIKYQKSWLESSLVYPHKRDVELSFYLYADRLKDSDDKSLYTTYQELLNPKGSLLFKSAGLELFQMAFLKCFADVENTPIDPKSTSFEFKADRVKQNVVQLFNDVQNNLNQVGDTYSIDYPSVVKTYDIHPDPKDNLYLIQLETYFLEKAGFEISDLGFKRLHHWGVTGISTEKRDLYSFIIAAKKKGSAKYSFSKDL